MAVLFVLVHLLPVKLNEENFFRLHVCATDESEEWEKENKQKKQRRIVVENFIYYWICGHNKPSIQKQS